MTNEHQHKALEALIAAALRLDESGPVTEADIAEKNLPQLTDDELQLFRERGRDILEAVKSREFPQHESDSKERGVADELVEWSRMFRGNANLSAKAQKELERKRRQILGEDKTEDDDA